MDDTVSQDLTGHPRLHADRDDLAAHALTPGGLDKLLDQVAAQTIDKPLTVRDRVRELPTPVRVAVALGFGVFAVVAVLAMLGIRPGLESGGLAGYLTAAGCLVAMVGLATSLSLRGMHQRQLGGWAWAITVGALLTPPIIALWPGLWPTAGAPAADVTGFGLRCIGLGLAVAAGVGLVMRFLQRVDRPGSWRVTSTAGAGGVVAFAAVQLNCPAADIGHLLVGHGLLGVILAVIGLAAVHVTRRA